MTEAMKELTPLLEKLAAKLGTTAEHLWGVLIKQAHIEGITAVCLIGLLIVLTISWGFFIAPKLVRKWSFLKEKRRTPYADDGEMYLVGTVVGSIAFSIAWIVTICSLSTILSCFYNPEYWALQKVLSLIGK